MTGGICDPGTGSSTCGDRIVANGRPAESSNSTDFGGTGWKLSFNGAATRPDPKATTPTTIATPNQIRT
jgi:hypothetical protein